MKISEAQAKIDNARKNGSISEKESQRMTHAIRRTGDYGQKWSWARQAEMRAIVVGGL